MTHAVSFFDQQFQRQIMDDDFTLNPFEQKALQYAQGRMLDFGCGLGNLSIAAARSGSRVVAVDASHAAITSLNERARNENLAIDAMEAEAGDFSWHGCFDTVAAIGLLMFMPCDKGRNLLHRLRSSTCEGGTIIVNVLVHGTSYLDMFGQDPYCLFAPDEVCAWFDDWDVVDFSIDEFAAPDHTIKRFATVVARNTMK